MNELQFNQETHTYRLGGMVIPSVTQALGGAGLIDTRWYTPEACQLGTYVHEATELYDMGVLDVDALDPVVAGYLGAWRRFRGNTGCEILDIERRECSQLHLFAGTVDRVLTIDGVRFVIDIKTGQPEPWHRLQTAAYAMMLAERGEHCERASIYLDPGVKYKLRIHDDPNDEGVFMAALTIHNWKGNQ